MKKKSTIFFSYKITSWFSKFPKIFLEKFSKYFFDQKISIFFDEIFFKPYLLIMKDAEKMISTNSNQSRDADRLCFMVPPWRKNAEYSTDNHLALTVGCFRSQENILSLQIWCFETSGSPRVSINVINHVLVLFLGIPMQRRFTQLHLRSDIEHFADFAMVFDGFGPNLQIWKSTSFPQKTRFLRKNHQKSIFLKIGRMLY